MKTIKLLIILAVISIIKTSTAQDIFLPDTVWIDTGKEIYVQLCLRSVKDVKELANMEATFQHLLNEKTAEKIISDPAQKLAIMITQLQNEEYLLVAEEMETSVYLPGNLESNGEIDYQLLSLKKNDQNKINCYFQSRKQLISFLTKDWAQQINKTNTALNNNWVCNSRKTITAFVKDTVQTTKVSLAFAHDGAKNLDQLELSAGAGMNFFKDKFLPNFSFRMALTLGNKGILKNSYFADYEIIYDFVEEKGKSAPKSGHFLSLGYMHNFTSNPDKNNWYGFSVGYLVSKKSEFFDDNTWRLSIHRKINKNIELSPQLNFPNNFENIFPGLKLKVNF